ncbi:hypothetical protein CBP52_17095 [Cellulomonas sp. PSBB021]|nr:hypothetical protein CBP52_17095 [Cellulomonas sp. PSBB021]
MLVPGRHTAPPGARTTALDSPRRRQLVALAAMACAAVVLATTIATQASSADTAVHRPADPLRVLKGTTLAAGASTTVTLPSVPSGTTAAELHVSVKPSKTNATVRVCPGTASTCSNPRTVTAAGGFANGSVLVAPSSGKVTLTALDGAKVWADVRGWSLRSTKTDARDSRYLPVEPRRAGTVSLTSKKTRTVSLSGVPKNATGAVVRLTSAAGATATNIGACATGSSPTCNGTTFLNPSTSRAAQASGVVALGGDGSQVNLYATGGSAHVSIDIDGFYVAASTLPDGGLLAPASGSLDARVISPGSSSTLTLSPPSGATAVHLRVRVSGAWRETVVAACPGTSATARCRSTSLVTASSSAPTYGDAVIPLGGSGGKSVTLTNTAASVKVAPEVLGWVVGGKTVTVASTSATTSATTKATATATAKATATATAKATATATPKPTATATAKPTSSPSPTSSPRATTAPTTPAPSPSASTGTGGKPGPSNTGVPSGVSLKVHDGDLVIKEDGAVISGLDIRGFVDVRASNVTIKNSIIRGYKVSTGRSLVQNTNGAPLLIQDSELFAASPSYWIDGVRGANITMRRVDVHDVIDSVRITGDDVRVEASWLHDNLHYASAPYQEDGTHDDNIQIQRGSDIVITGNTIEGAYNAAIMYSPGLGVVSDVTVSGNWIDGGGCSVNIAEQGRGPIQGLVFSKNTFGLDTRVDRCAIISPSTTVPKVSSNYYEDGKTVAVRQGG